MLTDAEYRHIIRNRSVLEGRIKTKEREEDEHTQAKQAAHTELESLKDEMAVYTNLLKGFIDEYEEYQRTHPPEEIEPRS